jgi:hypothetical protein
MLRVFGGLQRGWLGRFSLPSAFLNRLAGIHRSGDADPDQQLRQS